MAIIENRFKTYNNRSSYRAAKSISPSITTLANIAALAISLLVVINPNFLSINKHLSSFNGAAYSKIIDPTKEVVSKSINFMINIFNFSNLHKENITLKIENARLKNNLTETDNIKIENIKLSKIANFAMQQAPVETLKAKIIFHTKSDTEGLAVIAAGENHGVKLNSLVLVNGYLGGRIVTTGKNYSKASLVNSHSSRIPIKTSNTNVNAILVGSADDTGYLLHLHGSKRPVEGELILTSGNGSFYPKDIPVAKVKKVTEKTVTVSVFSDLSTVDFVEILDPSNFEN